MTFSFYCCVEISPEEQELVDTYKIHDHVLTWRETDSGRIPALTVGDLVRGKTYELEDVTTLHIPLLSS